MGTISFKATQGVYLTYKNYPYKTPQVFGEFIDNAIQSYENNKNLLTTMSAKDYLLRIEIGFDWTMDTDNVVKATKVTVRDNAAGMTEQQFKEAFDLANQRISRSGMNEFGVGMKAAASWLGNNWHIETTSITDKVTRILDVDLTEITDKSIEELESQEAININAPHGTTFVIESLWPERAIRKDNLKSLKKSIASIYRYFIRRKEIQIFIEDEILSFEDYEVLKAPSYKDPDGPDIEWKCPVNTDDRRGHSISGFIALLKDTADEKRGVVIMRNHRVVMGFDPQDRTIGKDFIGQIGSNKYRRVFGELEITGFTVAFGKNQVNDPELLEALCKMAAGKLLIQGVNLLTQCDKYRKKTRAASPKVAPLETPKPDSNPSIVPATTTTVPTPQDHNKAVKKTAYTEKGNTDIIAQGKFEFGSDDYRILIESGDDCDELFWNDLSQRDAKVLICKVNRSHPFFKLYGEPDKQMIAMMSALSIAKFKSSATGQENAKHMMNEFNRIINTQEALEQND